MPVCAVLSTRRSGARLQSFFADAGVCYRKLRVDFWSSSGGSVLVRHRSLQDGLFLDLLCHLQDLSVATPDEPLSLSSLGF